MITRKTKNIMTLMFSIVKHYIVGLFRRANTLLIVYNSEN